MKKNGNKPGNMMRFIAILCAAVLAIQTLPAAMPVSLAVRAAETEESTSEKKEEETKEEKKEEETAQEEEKKEEASSEEKKEEETKQEEKKEETSSEDKQEEETKQEEKKEETSSEDKKEETSSEDKKEETSSEDKKEETQQEEKKEEAPAGDNNDQSSQNQEEKNEETPAGDSKEQSSQQQEEKKDESGSDPSQKEDGSSSDKKDESSEEKGTDESKDQSTGDSAGSKEGTNETKEGEEPGTTNPDPNPEKENEETKEDETISLKSEDIKIMKDGEEVSRVAVGKDDKEIKLTGTISKDGISENDYDFSWEKSVEDGSDADQDSAKLEDDDKQTVTISSVKGHVGGELNLTLSVKPKDGGSAVKKDITLSVYTEYGVDKVLLEKKADGQQDGEEIKSGDTAEYSDKLSAKLTFIDQASADDQVENQYQYKWQVKETGKDDFENLENGSGTGIETTVTAEKTGIYRVVFSREKDDDNQRLEYESENYDVTVEKKAIKASVSVAGKNFNNTTAIADDAIQEIKWTSVNEYPVSVGNSAKIMVKKGEESHKLEASDLKYETAGNVDEDTGVKVVLKDDDAEFSFELGEDEKDKFEVGSIEFNEPVISKVEMEASDAAEPDGITGVTVDGITYVKPDSDGKAVVTLNKLGSHTIANQLSEPDPAEGEDGFADTAVCDVQDTDQVKGAVFYAKDEKGDIAKLVLDSVQIDEDGPSISGTITPFLSNSGSEDGSFEITDEKSGVGSVYYLVSENDSEEYSEENASDWTKVEPADGKYNISIAAPAFGKVHVYAADQLGNETYNTENEVLYETEPPSVEIKGDENAEKPTQKNSVTVNAEDKDAASGIKQIVFHLYDDNGDDLTKSSEAGSETDPASGTESGAGSTTVSFETSDSNFKFDGNILSRTAEDPVTIADTEQFKKIEDLEITVSGAGLSGNYKLTAEVIDYCGNSKKIEIEEGVGVVFDTTAPTYTVELLKDPNDALRENEFYNATYEDSKTNSGLIVTFKDDYLDSEGGDFRVVLYNPDDAQNKKEAVVSIDEGKTTGTAVVPRDEIARLKDGSIYVVVTAVDAAGNVAESAEDSGIVPQSISVSPESAGENGYKVATFILDTTSPVLKSEATETAALDGSEGGEPDLIIPGGYYLYSGTFKTAVTITDEHIDESLVKASFTKINITDDTDIASIDGPKNDNGTINITFYGKSKGDVGSLRVIATDLAGNPLQIDQSLVEENEPSQDHWKVLEATDTIALGTVETVHERRLQNQIPLATVILPQTQKTDDSSNKKAYYNEDITAVVRLSKISGPDEYGNPDTKTEEPFKVTVKKNGEEYLTVSPLGDNPGTNVKVEDEINNSGNKTGNKIYTITLTIPKSDNGDYEILVVGKNKAGNEVRIVEESPSGDKSGVQSVNEYNANNNHYTLVIDTKRPQVIVSITPSKNPDRPDLQTIGTTARFYFNCYHSFEAIVSDDNTLEDSSISVTYETIESYDDANSIGESYETGQKTSRSGEAGRLVFKHDVKSDGVIRYLITGTDLAGNSIEISETSKYLNTKATDGADAKVYSYPIVTDTVKPVYTLKYTNDGPTDHTPYFNNKRKMVLTLNEKTLDLNNCPSVSITKDKSPVQGSWSRTGSESSYDMVFEEGGEYIVKIDGEDDDSNISFTDLAGNSTMLDVEDTGKAPFHFYIDKTAPNVSIRMALNKPDQDGNYYYNKNNCGITIRFDDNGNNLEASDGKAEYSVVVRSSSGDVEVKPEKNNVTKSDKEITVQFPEKQIQQLKDGKYLIKVIATDFAGNRTELKDLTVTGCKKRNLNEKGIDYPCGEFILDTTAPEIISVVTNPDEYPATDNYVYKDTNSVYYNRAAEVIVRVKDANVSDKQISGVVTRDGKQISCTRYSKSDKNQLLAVVFSLEENYTYKDIIVSGADKAGNQLVLRKTYEHNKNDALKSEPGKVTSIYGKVIDTVSPLATISYTSADQANMYSNETSVKGRKSAYYNKPITVTMKFSDNYELDGQKLYAGLEGKETKQTKATGSKSYAVGGKNGTRITKDGRSVFTAYGTDRALNPTFVTEKAPTVDTNTTSAKFEDTTITTGGFTNKNLTKQTPFKAMYELVLDQTAPTFKLAISSPESTNKKLNEQGNRYYFNSQYTAKYTITETNYDASKISLKKGSITGRSYDSGSDEISSYPKTISSENRVFTDKVNDNGIYRYAIYGSDKAGNALVPSEETHLETISKSAVDTKGEKKKGSVEDTADVSYHVVVDKTKPEGFLTIRTGKTTIYTMNTNGDVTFAEPYRKETNASIKIAVDTTIERTPVNISYIVESTRGSGKRNVSNSTYKYGNSASTDLSGKQIFRVAEYKFTDLAGNVTTYKAENRIYLDEDHPTIDTLAPTINIVAKAKPGTNGYRNGQPLFRSDVPLSIIVSDPDSANSSSGLADITYQVYVGGHLVDDDTAPLNKKNKQTHKENYTDEKLTYKISKTKTVNGKSHNNNDVEVVVTAYDNAGNKREMKYNFGIDVTPPTVRVTYDNNNAQNGEYFKENRVATVEVTERNFDPSKFRIATQNAASISGWSHTGKGGNGDSDVWTAHVTYATDGNYTLEVSGEDLLGNKASDIKYDGVAPRKFTIDKTAPAITVTYDNNDVRNEKYYKATRTATINVNDVNFNGQNDIKVQATGGGTAPTVSFNGHTATLHFPEDGVYIFNGTVTDMAGNQTTIPVQTEFVIDTKPPVLVFEDGKPFKVEKAKEANGSDHPINWQFFTKDGFAPKVTVIDTNISTAEQDAIFEIFGQKMANRFTGTTTVHPDDNTKFDMAIDSLTFRVSEEIDDVYHVRALAVDLAGNESEVVEFDFSINRFGSSYAADKDDNPDNAYEYSTYGYIRDSYYHNSTRDLTIYEFNTNSLKKDSQKVEMMKDGNTANVTTLVPGTDYTFEEVPNKGDKLKTYQYKILSSVFEEEGDYSFTISSDDEAGHHNSTSRVHKGKDEEGKEKLYVDSFPIDFVIDKTPPTNQLAGVRSDKKVAVNNRNLAIEVRPEDAQTAVSKVEIRRWIGDTLGFSVPKEADEPIQTIIYEYYDDESNPKPADTDLIKYEDLAAYTDEVSDKININYEMSDNQNWQWVEIITTDLAGNESEDIRAGAAESAETVRYSENRRGFLVTTNTFSQIINNMAARIGAAGVIILLLVFLFLRKKKKDSEEGAVV